MFSSSFVQRRDKLPAHERRDIVGSCAELSASPAVPMFSTVPASSGVRGNQDLDCARLVVGMYSEVRYCRSTVPWGGD